MQQIAEIEKKIIENAINKYGEIVLKKNNMNKVVIMSMQEYNDSLLDNETIDALLHSEDDIENGRTRKGKDVIKELKQKYGF